MKKQNINLMDNFLEIEKRRSAKTDRIAVFAAILLVVVLLLSAYSFKLLLDNNDLKNGIKTSESFINDPSIKARVALVEVEQKKISDLKEIDTILDQLNVTFAAFPRINTLILQKLTVNLPAGASFRTIAFDGQGFAIEYNCLNYSQPSEYAIRLQNSKFFEEVNYSGYTTEIAGNVTRYSGKLVAILKVGK